MIDGRKDEEERRPKQHEEEYRHRGPQTEGDVEPILHVPVVEPQWPLALVADPKGVGRLVIRQVPHDEAAERRIVCRHRCRGRRCDGGCWGGSGGGGACLGWWRLRERIRADIGSTGSIVVINNCTPILAQGKVGYARRLGVLCSVQEAHDFQAGLVLWRRRRHLVQ